uniref:Uncharacterized protein n=1 Tax=Nelumbo nucifera TaxID=4432 RepID=A0A822YEU5_NELNU|nr:TPA_asm: hypothetical protein HUJ06_030943 [Nelumbo nucifera]
MPTIVLVPQKTKSQSLDGSKKLPQNVESPEELCEKKKPQCRTDLVCEKHSAAAVQRRRLQKPRVQEMNSDTSETVKNTVPPLFNEGDFRNLGCRRPRRNEKDCRC